MVDVLIRDLSEAVLAGVDAHAARLGLSRVEYIRRRLAADAASTDDAVSTEDLSPLPRWPATSTTRVMGAAWQ